MSPSIFAVLKLTALTVLPHGVNEVTYSWLVSRCRNRRERGWSPSSRTS